MAVEQAQRVVGRKAHDGVPRTEEALVPVGEGRGRVLVERAAHRGQRAGREPVVGVQEQHERGARPREARVASGHDARVRLSHELDPLGQGFERRVRPRIGGPVVDHDHVRRSPLLREERVHCLGQVGAVVEAGDDGCRVAHRGRSRSTTRR